MNEVCTIVYLAVFLEPTSTSQLPFLSTAHSSWRYTATVWAHPHKVQNGGGQNICHNIWGWFKVLCGDKGQWCSQTGWYNSAGVWWAEHIPMYNILGCVSLTLSYCVNQLNRSLIDIHLGPTDCGLASCFLVCDIPAATDMQPPLLQCVLTVCQGLTDSVVVSLH